MDSARDRLNGLLDSFSMKGLLFGLLLALLVAPTVHAGGEYIPAGQPVPTSIRYVNTTPTGVNTSAGFRYPTSGGSAYTTRPVAVGAGTLGGLLSGAVRRGLGLYGVAMTIRSIVDGAGWVINELSNEITTKEKPSEELTGTEFWCATPQQFILPATYCTSSSSAMGNFLVGQTIIGNGSNEYGKIVTAFSVAGNGNVYANSVQGGTLVAQVTVVRQSTLPTEYYTPGAQPAVPVSNEDLGNLVKNHPDVVNAILVDPVTGAPIRTGELIDALNSLRQSMEAANGLPPADDLLPSEDFAEDTPSQTEWPGFCDWASVVCDFITWFKKEDVLPDQPQVPYEESSVEFADYDSGLGGGTCPSPYVVPVLDGDFEIQWDGLCTFVGYLRPVLIACAWFVAGLIVVRARK